MAIQSSSEEPARRELAVIKTPRNTHKIGIYNETDRLRKVMVWGPLGAETVLAQIYPKDISLFYQDMNVLGARQEAYGFAETLKQLGVEVISARDILANLLSKPSKFLQKREVINAILLEIRKIRAKYKKSSSSARNKINFEKQIKELIEKDIERYGEHKALVLNKTLCLDADYPPGNIIYARDQMNVLLGTRFVSNMKYPIRKPEIALYEQVYHSILSDDVQSFNIPEGETFEGGDAYIHNGTVYVGVGVRTTRGAVKFIYNTLKPQLDHLGLRFAIVEDEHPETRSQKDNMDFMHLDTFSGPIGDRQIAVCKEEAERRRVKFFDSNERGQVEVEDTGENFLQHLMGREDLVVVIPRKEQQEFGCNFLALDGNTILMPLDSNPVTNQRLRDAGKNLIFLGLKESTRGYGASHCMTGQLVRAR